MKPIYRITLSLFALLIFIVLFCFVWLESVLHQAVGLCAVLVLAACVFGAKKLLHELRNLSLFILFLVVIYGLFALLQIGEGTAYWLHYGITRSSLLINTLLFMQIVVTRIKIDDILDFPLDIHKLKYIILGKLLFIEASGSYAQLCVFMKLIPTQQQRNRNVLWRLRSSLAVLLALLSFTIHEATLKGEMIDERIRCCHKNKH